MNELLRYTYETACRICFCVFTYHIILHLLVQAAAVEASAPCYIKRFCYRHISYDGSFFLCELKGKHEVFWCSCRLRQIAHRIPSPLSSFPPFLPIISQFYYYYIIKNNPLWLWLWARGCGKLAYSYGTRNPMPPFLAIILQFYYYGLFEINPLLLLLGARGRRKLVRDAQRIHLCTMYYLNSLYNWVLLRVILGSIHINVDRINIIVHISLNRTRVVIYTPYRYQPGGRRIIPYDGVARYHPPSLMSFFFCDLLNLTMNQRVA